MKTIRLVKAVALTLVGGIIFAGGGKSLADEIVEHDEAALAWQWIKYGDDWNQYKLTNIVTGWSFKTPGNKKDTISLDDCWGIPAEFPDLDLSALDGKTVLANGQTLKVTGFNWQKMAQAKDVLESVKLPSSVTTLGGWAFGMCSKLKTVSPLEQVTEINQDVFNSCSNFTGYDSTGDLYLPNLKSLKGANIFKTTKIKSVNFPNLTTLNGAFDTCKYLTNAVLPKVKMCYFKNCEALKRLYAPLIETIGEYNFDGCKELYNDDGTVIFPNVLKVDGTRSFASCKKIKCVELPQCLSLNSQYMFSDCTSLVRVEIPCVTNISTIQYFSSGIKCIKLSHAIEPLYKEQYVFQNVTNLFIHDASPVRKKWADGELTSNAVKSSAINAILYGGKTEVEGINWVYDDTVWNDETNNYDLQAESVTILAAKGTLDTDLTIPKKITIGVRDIATNGELTGNTANATVTAIEARAFRNNEGLIGKTVFIPNSVSRIGVAAFPQGCYMKVRAGENAEALVSQLNSEYGEDEEGKPYASIDNKKGFMIIVK